ncbi:MAG TPA: maltose alpha-D-glucosyltransferase [Candidatus Limnocylindria bacterium]|nr:maltose alpha-D-glucosyltransferase [Candidatus Limnocylindria bacterium]
MLETDPLWYRDAIVYQTHVKAFQDSNGDGVGDVRGLTSRLDYLAELGVTALWLLPFFPSPLRDDGYDISDYTSVHPSYGTLDDVKRLVAEAHDRGIRVIAELVVNHTSDQHPWFQRARRAPRGSAERAWYVWSDDDKRYQGTRIIFTDTEYSNWAWDPLAGQYYWHRFFAHQPDLNFDNPEVLRAIIDVMRFWSKIGVDGFRLDAVPYLCEREGTNNENLPETHAAIKILRAVLEKEFPDRIFLAEANQWPEDLNAYFGEGDECHMCFHFPLMPRMFMAIADADRYPIHDILRQTPPIPDGCQWAVFLRNHDELTLEMVSDRERERMNQVYAVEPRMRINVGIRRRLAPLLENDRRRIELMNGLLLAMPGTPVIYYGDEIGMGDNLFLKDRDGVRTPMQWSPDRNGGFSSAEPVRLYAPAVTDPTYGYLAVNVEGQQRTSSSLLNWMRRIIAVRKASRVFGRGTLTLLYPANRHVLAFLREFEDDTVLVVANLAPTAEAVQLDLSAFAGRTPFEMLGSTAFPPITTASYTVTLAPYGFYWFSMVRDPAGSAAPIRSSTLPELPTVVVPRERIAFDRWARAVLESDVVPLALGADERGRVRETFIGGLDPQITFAIVGNDTRTISLPLRFVWNEPIREDALARARSGPREGWIVDAATDATTALIVERGMREGTMLHDEGTMLFADEGNPTPEASTSQRLGAASGVQRWVLDDERLLTLHREMPRIEDSGVAFLRHLRERGFVRVPALHGTALYVDAAGAAWVVATSQHYVSHPTDAESSLREVLRAGTADERLLRSARVAADGLAALHAALAAPGSDPTFTPTPIGQDDLRAWRAAAQADLQALLAARVEGIEELQEAIEHALDVLPSHVDAVSARSHGRLTLSRVLLVEGAPVFVGFGEPVAEKSSPLKDVASLTRSFESVARETVIESGHDPTTDLRETRSVAREMIGRAHQTFLTRYFESAATLPTTPSDPAHRLAMIRFFRMRGALRGVRAALARTYTTLPRALAALRAECSREPLA